jgi:integrase
MIRTLKRGATFHVDYSIGDRRLRGSLGTKDKNVASRLKSRIEISMAEGARSAGWVDLRKVLPVETYHRLAGHAGLSRQAVPSWSGLVSIFWKDCDRRRLAKGTLVRYQSTVDRFAEFLESVGFDLLEDLTAHVIRDFRDWRQAQILKNSRSRNGGGLYQDMSALHFIFACGVENGLIAKNPVAKESRPAVVRGTKPYTGAELTAIREACEPEELLIFLLFRWTGMRGSDVADLRWADVHFVDGEIRRKAIKNGVWLQIPIHPELRDVLVAAQKPEGHVLTVKNKVVDRAFLARQMRLIYCKANIADGHNHRFRASLAVDLLLKGATVYEVAKVLGDTGATVEKHYLRFVPQMRDRVRGFMDDDTKGLEAR